MAFSRAAAIPSRESALSSNMVPPSLFWAEQFQQLAERIIKAVYDTLFQRNDRVVCDSDVFGANFGATLCDVAIAEALRLLQFGKPILRIERMHLQCRDMNKKTRANEFVVLAMVAQDVADILAKETFDALPKFLDPVDVHLGHPPGPVGRIRRARLEFFDLLLDLEFPRDVGHQVF